MKKQLEEVQDYFRTKIVNGDFEIKETEEHYCTVTVDSEYDFTIWVSNAPRFIELYGLSNRSTNVIDFDFNPEEKKAVWSHLEEAVTNFNNTEILSRKRKQFEALKAELGI